MRIAIVGLGYVGLPLAAAFGEKYETIGFDINARRIAELREGNDRTLELTADQIKSAKMLKFTSDLEDLRSANFYIVTVPTPIDSHKNPDLTPLIRASETIGKVLKKGDIVVYESTVYPGCTEEECVPVLEKFSGLKFNADFYCGYSPERINPGDKEHTVTKIKKVTSGSTPKIAEKVDEIYRSVIAAGTFKASGIKVAEAAKVIENSQRDINIAFVNELALIFARMGIDTSEVLEAAGTKWNFLPFRPGLVGGHCIGVDPYYLTYKAESLGYHPQVILSGRRINDSMGAYVAAQTMKLMNRRGVCAYEARVLMLGITFKENCPDIRNSRAIDIARELEEFGAKVMIYDPWADPSEARHEYGADLEIARDLPAGKFEAVVAAVAHNEFKSLNPRSLLTEKGVVFDVKNVFAKDQSDGRL
ncbi:MAG: Vi polysaccharide biosynthesis UDP-N-acetylglucosamine C-6 dehydrogenase TviB [Helicobacteraceae bacterium]|nr:Vi polysaccharide biosynthesis UDP-N-acetylglucosamine C-6 dehydrogenase TviB [Helicobacteraceae bacterium]